MGKHYSLLAEKFDSIIFKIISEKNNLSLRKNFMKLYKDVLDFDAASFDIAKVENDQIIFYDPKVLNIGIKFVHRYYSHFQYIDTMAFFFSQDKKDVYRTSDYISEKMRKASEYYNEWLVPQNLFYSIGAKIGNKKLYGSVNFWRSKVKGDYTDKDIKNLSIFTKYLSKKFFDFEKSEKSIEKDEKRKNDFYDECKLTKRERELADKLLNGKKIKDIAAALFISEDTVKKHSNHIYKKLNIKNKSELIITIKELKWKNSN
ncbi:MAG: helix-turn-helix transcriptional regulator [Clostridiales Family XIII bacterium]|jgi:DNA-binding CsgD family transcriptional regulator|nr:helix-turn-helix transcriptional regulator [Clostridiales Family XIII bacterium]